MSEIPFKTFWKSLSPAQKETLAIEAVTTVVYLSQVANGHRKVGLQTITKLKRANSEITDYMLRPDLFSENVKAA